VKGRYNKRKFKSQLKEYLEKKIMFAKNHGKNAHAQVVLQISEMIKKMHEDKEKFENDKKEFFRVRRWI